MGRKKPGRKQEPASKHGILWPRWTGFGGKTVWEWLQLLIVPLALALIGILFTMQQDARQQAIEDQRAASERKLEDQRAQDAALQAYLDQMTSLLLEKDLRNSEEGSEVQTLAQARTLTVLGRLDPSRKTEVMRFLLAAQLVQSVDGNEPVILLYRADLHGADLSYADLRGAELSSADLSDADLSYAELPRAQLAEANLNNADLRLAGLSDAYLGSADLRDADLRDAYLVNAYLSNAELSNANLEGSELDGAPLYNADLSDADLSDTDLAGADLRRANLGGAKLDDADLNSADLTRAEGVTEEELEQAAASLASTTMPDRSLHAGRYTTQGFEPALSLWLSGGLRLGEPETADTLLFWTGPEEGQLLFTSSRSGFPLYVFDPSNPSEPKEVPAPENADAWASWFQRHPNLETSKPVPVSVGGASGMRIDITETSAPENYPQDVCGFEQPCVPLFPYSSSISGSSAIVSYGEVKDRFVIVDLEGETVVINISAPADKFDEVLPKAQKALDTVKWENISPG